MKFWKRATFCLPSQKQPSDALLQLNGTFMPMGGSLQGQNTSKQFKNYSNPIMRLMDTKLWKQYFFIFCLSDFLTAQEVCGRTCADGCCLGLFSGIEQFPIIYIIVTQWSRLDRCKNVKLSIHTSQAEIPLLCHDTGPTGGGQIWPAGLGRLGSDSTRASGTSGGPSVHSIFSHQYHHFQMLIKSYGIQYTNSIFLCFYFFFFSIWFSHVIFVVSQSSLLPGPGHVLPHQRQAAGQRQRLGTAQGQRQGHQRRQAVGGRRNWMKKGDHFIFIFLI